MSYDEISERIKKMEKDLSYVNVKIDPEQMKTEMLNFANDFMNQGDVEFFGDPDNAKYAKIRCCIILANFAIENYGKGENNDYNQ